MFSSSILLENKKTNIYENKLTEDNIANSSSINSGYEKRSPKLRKRIINVLGNIDIYENKKSSDCYPDYKFPEIRWGDDNIKSKNLDMMSDEEIKNKFQLLTKDVKQRKKMICKQCYQSGKRNIAFDIPYFYQGDENWGEDIPKKGKDAELGCIGCAWYDFAEWRRQLIKILEKNKYHNNN